MIFTTAFKFVLLSISEAHLLAEVMSGHDANKLMHRVFNMALATENVVVTLVELVNILHGYVYLLVSSFYGLISLHIHLNLFVVATGNQGI